MRGERLKEARLNKGLTQAQLGARIGTSKTTISQYESGARDPDSDTVGLLAQLLDVSTDWLLGLSDNPRRIQEFTFEQVKEAVFTYGPDVDPRALEIAKELTKMGFPMNRKEELLTYARFIAEQVKRHTPSDKLDK